MLGSHGPCKCERKKISVHTDRARPRFPSVEATYRLGYKRVPNSWDGDPAPRREAPIEPGGPKGVLDVPDPARSLGELRPVEVPDMGWVVGM